MIYINSAVNPILYNLTSSRFRESLSRLMGLRKKQMSISRTSSFPPGMALQMGVVMPMISTTSHHLERANTIDWNMDKKKLANGLQSLKNHNTNAFGLTRQGFLSAESSPYLTKRTSSSLTISTQYSSSGSVKNYRTQKYFYRRKPCKATGEKNSKKHAFGSKSNLNGKSPFLGRSATMPKRPSHLSDHGLFPSNTLKMQCDVPTCHRACSYKNNSCDSSPNSIVSPAKSNSVLQGESYV